MRRRIYIILGTVMFRWILCLLHSVQYIHTYIQTRLINSRSFEAGRFYVVGTSNCDVYVDVVLTLHSAHGSVHTYIYTGLNI